MGLAIALLTFLAERLNRTKIGRGITTATAMVVVVLASLVVFTLISLVVFTYLDI